MSQSLVDPVSVQSSRDASWGAARVDEACAEAVTRWIDGERRARLIVSPNLDVVWMNKAARALHGEGEAFVVEAGRLAAPSRAVAGLVASARADEARCAVMPGEGGRRWVVWAREVGASPGVMIGLTFHRARSETRFQALIDNHLLTPSEGRIIEMLLGGAETGRIAQALDISIETLRTHLKHAYRKLGVRSRGELFAEAISFVGP